MSFVPGIQPFMSFLVRKGEAGAGSMGRHKTGRREKKARVQGVWKRREKRKKEMPCQTVIKLQARKPKNIVRLLEIPINSPWR